MSHMLHTCTIPCPPNVALVCHVTRAREAIVLGCRVRSMSCHISCPKVSQCAKCTSANVPGFLPFCKFYTMSFRVGRSCKSHVCRVRSVLLHVVRLCVYTLKVKSATCVQHVWHDIESSRVWMTEWMFHAGCILASCVHALCVHALGVHALCVYICVYIWHSISLWHYVVYTHL